MPAIESLTSLLLAAAGTAIFSIVAGGSATNAAADAAATAQVLKAMTDESVIWYSLAGGMVGAIASWALGFLPQDLGEGSRKMMGSALFAMIAAPGTVVYFHFPQTIIPVISISGGYGLVANMALIKLMPLFVNLLPGWMVNLFKSRGIDTDQYDMTNGRSHAEKQRRDAPTEKMPKLNTPPAHRRRVMDDPDPDSP